MSIRIECKCGLVMQGDDIDEVLTLTQAHDEKCKDKVK